MDIYNDGTYLKNNPSWHLQDSKWKANHLASLICSDVIKSFPKRPIRVVDIGCGAGGVLKNFIESLNNKNVKVTAVGYDISAKAIEIANKIYPQLDVRCDDFLSINDEYDVALVVDLVEHIINPEDFLFKLRAKASLFLFHIPLDENYWDKIKMGENYYIYLAKDRGHVNYFHKTSAFSLLDKCGYKINTWKYTPWGFELRSANKGKLTTFIRIARKIGYSTCRNLSIRLLGGASLAILCST